MNDFRKRLFAITISICILFFIDVCILFYLQIVNSHQYKVLSDKNRIRIYSLYPKRGEIYDKNGNKLAYNTQTYRLRVANGNIKKILKTIEKLRKYIEVEISEEEIIKGHNSTPIYSYITIKDSLSWEEYARLSLYLFDLEDVLLEQSIIRKYIDNFCLSNIIGYTGPCNNVTELMEGKMGIERSQNDLFVGTLGNKKIEINSRMKFVREISAIQPIDGLDVTLTIDFDLQKFVYEALSQYEAASCVVIDLKNGHVLCSVSVPSVDINMLSQKVSLKNWNEIINNKYKPMNDRVLRSLYPPGSIFKLFLAYAALDSKVISKNDKILCSGYTLLGKHKFHCWNRNGHGYVDMNSAISQSCDVYFHEVSKRLGIENISYYAKEFGFGDNTGCEISESQGLVPSKKWKITKLKESWKQYETILVGTGQGYLLANLMQLAAGVAKLCVCSTSFRPVLLLENNAEMKKNLDIDIINSIKAAMYDVCNSHLGTASSSCKTKYGIAGKTGTSQVRRMRSGEHGISQNLLTWEDRDHAIFVGFSPYFSPRYVIALLVEHGGGGASVAAPAARKVFDWLIANKDVNK